MEKIFEEGNTLPEQRKSFFEEYEGLERSEKTKFRKRIMSWCEIEQSTFQEWIRKKKVPPLAKKVIALYLNAPQSEIFPIK